MRRLFYLPAFAVLLAPPATAAGPAEEKAAVEAIEKIGGKVIHDDKADGQPVVAVNLFDNQKVKGADLKHLRAFPQLRKLDLGFTGVGDEGLRQLHDLKALRELNIGYVKVSKEAVQELRKALPDCKINGP
jgi:hypothetical protein